MTRPRSRRDLSSGPRLTRRRALLYLLDLTILVASFWIAYLLRFDFVIPGRYQRAMLEQLPLVVGVQVLAILAAGIPSFIWRYVGLRESRAFASAGAFALVPLLVLRALEPQGWTELKVPVSVLLMDGALAFGGMLGARVLRRAMFERQERRRRRAGDHSAAKPVVLVGAGRAGILAVRELQGRSDVRLEIVGFLDDDPLKRGMVINGVRVLGSSRDLPRVAQTHGVKEAIITIAEPTPEEMRKFRQACAAAGITARTIPGFYEILLGKVSIERFRPIEPEDLLTRKLVSLDQTDEREFVVGRRLMVTGAGGSIGSELARQVAVLDPAELILVERAEFSLFEIHREILRRWPGLRVQAIVADVGDRKRMRGVFRGCMPEIVIHAAAHKHVPLMEVNPHEAVRNNVLATHSLAAMSGEFNVETFVLVSSDKAVQPKSIMGATKRMAELVIQNCNDRFATRYIAVRFGNVMGSVGSVIPIFEEQIRAGGPVTVTHPDMKRYFMTIPEAVALVLKASTMGQGGEIFLLDMGEPMRIVELAERLIRLHGFEPHIDIPIEFTGVRPGEKLFEELGNDAEELMPTRHLQVLMGRIRRPSREAIDDALRELDASATMDDPERIRAFLDEFLDGSRLLERAVATAPQADNDAT